MRTGELTRLLAIYDIGLASQGGAEEHTLVVWMWEISSHTSQAVTHRRADSSPPLGSTEELVLVIWVQESW